MPLGRTTRVLAASVLLVAPMLVGAVSPGLPHAAAAVTPLANPEIREGCGITTTLVLDASGSVSSSGAVEDVRHAADAYLSALSNTNSSARVTQFATITQQLAPSTVVTPGSLSSNGTLRRAINGYYNPIPPRPGNANIYSYNSGNPLSSSSYTQSNNSNQYTNWDQSLDQAGETAPDLVVYITDGDPTAFDFNKAGDPFDPGPPPDVAVRTDRSSQAAQVTLDRAVEEANQIKGQQSRMLAIGVGAALSNPASQDRLEQIAGPQVVQDADLVDVDSINEIDVALVTDFEDLAALMRKVVIELCSPSLTIRKMAQTAGDATYAPAQGWDMTVTPTVPGGSGFRWILPTGATGASQTLPTNADGFAQFQWEPDPPEASSAANVAEAIEPGYTAGRPNAPDWRCELRDQEGDVRVEEGEFANPAAPEFDLDPIAQEIVTCTVYNSFDYAPDIVLTKTNAPTEVRGDLNPPAEITSTFHATNPGNTPLANVSVVDDQCGPVRPVPQTGNNQGDTNDNGLLDPGEDWLFRCQQRIQTPASTDPAGQNLVNTADVIATDPAGTEVTDTASDDVDAFNPAVSLTKLVNGQNLVTIPQGQNVTYTYAATNEGNAPLQDVTLIDNTPPCQAPTRGADAPGNNDAIMDVGETWNYSCVAAPTAAVVNTATVTGTPRNPVANAPFPDPNPVVTDTDTATVEVVNPAIELTKTATPEVVLLDPSTPVPPEPVTYTFGATNTGDAPLNRPGATTQGPARNPGWITDSRCTSPAVYLSGDTNNNSLLDPDETWQFSCPGQVTAPTVNTAGIIGQPSAADGTPLPGVDPVDDTATAFVDVVVPGISITKTSLRGVVLDPDAPAVAGPDVPDRRPAEYVYQVANNGNVTLDLGAGPVDDKCPTLILTGGDDGSGLLEPGEVWNYSCSTVLDRDDANTPPVTGAESGLVRNTVTVHGVPIFEGAPVPDKAVDDSDTAEVLVIEPGLTITKVASADAVRVDSSVTYTFLVRNTGDVGLDLIGPLDDKCGALEFLGGDRNNNGLVEGANGGLPEVWRYECTRTLGLPEPPETSDVNTVAVSALDPLGNLYVATDSAEVAVLDPAINLVKTVSESLVPVGHTVGYSFEVTNVGSSPIAANDVLANVQLGDLSSPPNDDCLSPALVSKTGGNGDDLLERDPPEVWTYACEGTIDVPTTDVALVSGIGGTTFDLEIPVFDIDTAFVQPFHPAIQVIKSATPKQLVGPGEVTYTYEVTNPGDVPLAGVADRITDDTCSPVRYVSGDEDGDGLLDTPDSIFEDAADETWIFTCTTEISETTTNTVVVEGSPVDDGGVPLCAPDLELQLPRIAQGCDVDDRDKATVRVLAPASIEITKETTTTTDTRFGFSLAANDFKLGDGDSKLYDGLAPGTYRVRESGADGWDLTTIRCTGDTGDVDIDRAGSNVLIGLDEGQSVSCTFTNQITEELPAGGSTGDIPDTGAPPWIGRMIALGVLLIVIGSALVLAGRRAAFST